MTLLEIYTKILKSMKMTVDENGYIYTNTSDDKIQMTADNLPLVLPTKEHIATLLAKNEETGKVEVTKVLFNPFNENSIKQDSPSLRKVKLVTEKLMAHSMGTAAQLLLLLAENNELQANTKLTTLEINKFLGSLNEAKAQGVDKVVDSNSIDKFQKLFKKTLTGNRGLLKLHLKKQAMYKNTKYNRLAILSSPLLDDLEETEKDESLHGVKLRRKDLIAFRLLLRFLLKDLDEKDTIVNGSNDGTAPGFLSIFDMYLTIIARLNRLIKTLETINVELADSGKVPLHVTHKELQNIERFASELAVIPSEVEINRDAARNNTIEPVTLDPNNLNSTRQNSILSGIPTEEKGPKPVETVQHAVVKQNVESGSVIDQILTKTGANQVVTGNPVYPGMLQQTTPTHAGNVKKPRSIGALVQQNNMAMATNMYAASIPNAALYNNNMGVMNNNMMSMNNNMMTPMGGISVDPMSAMNMGIPGIGMPGIGV